jgi:hypothetical protein
MNNHKVLARWTGYCASCPQERPLLLVSHGPHGFRGWLAGGGPEDRTLSYTCGVCGRDEHVPLTEDADAVHDATLLRWDDWVAPPVPAPVVLPLLRRPVVRVVTLPVPQVRATDLFLAAA